MNRRVVITGVGMVTPLGTGKTAFAQALFSGAGGIGPLAGLGSDPVPTTLAAQVRDFTPSDFIGRPTLRRMDRLSQMATASVRMAIEDAGIAITPAHRDVIGIVLGTSFGATDVAAQFGKVIFTESPRFANPILVPNTVMNAPAGHAAVELGLRGINATVNHREASAEGAIAFGADAVARGRAEVILAGGGDILSPFCLEVLRHFNLLSPLDSGPASLKPFDAQRNGTLIGEGFGVVCLESLQRAQERGATIYGELAGWGMAAAPSPPNDWPDDPRGALLAAERALSAAGVEAGQVDAVCSGANGGQRLDRLEVAAIDRLLGHRPWVTALKGALGESFASGGMRTAAMAMALQQGILAPVVGLATPMADLNFVRRPQSSLALRHAMLTGFASGGTFIVLLLKHAQTVSRMEDRP